MRLTYSPASPFARKVRAAAIELGLGDRITLEPVKVTPGQRDAIYAETINPLCKLPALVRDDGSVIVDSTVICEYLDDLAGGGRIIPKAGEPRWRALTRHAVANGLCEAAVLIRYETWLRPEAHRWDVWLEDQWEKVHGALGWFERGIDQSDDIDLSWITLACGLGYLDFRFPDSGWAARCPRLAERYREMLRRPCLAETQPTA